MELMIFIVGALLLVFGLGYAFIAVVRCIGRGVASVTTSALEEVGVSKDTAKTIGCVVGGVTAGMIAREAINDVSDMVNSIDTSSNIASNDSSSGQIYTDQYYNDSTDYIDSNDSASYADGAASSQSYVDSNNYIDGIQDKGAMGIDTSIYAASGVGAFSAGNMLDFGSMTVDTTIDIPEIQDNPYMLFTACQPSDNFRFSDASGIQQISVIDGNVYDSTNTLIGGLNRNDVTGVTTFNNLANEPIMSVDSQNNIYAGTPEMGHFVGHVDKSGAVSSLRDMAGGIISYTDQLGNAWSNGKPLGSIRKI